jgi:hypothetical protein
MWHELIEFVVGSSEDTPGHLNNIALIVAYSVEWNNLDISCIAAEFELEYYSRGSFGGGSEDVVE